MEQNMRPIVACNFRSLQLGYRDPKIVPRDQNIPNMFFLAKTAQFFSLVELGLG